MACMMCGKRWPIGAAASINTVKLSDKDGEMSVKKQCRNCGREMVIQADGLCGGCNGARKELLDIITRFPKQRSALLKKKTHRGVVQVLHERRHELMVEVDKITEAINTIQKYEAE